jgi:hypothetical protein
MHRNHTAATNPSQTTQEGRGVFRWRPHSNQLGAPRRRARGTQMRILPLKRALVETFHQNVDLSVDVSTSARMKRCTVTVPSTT